MMDADIAAYGAKRAYDSVRPATAIPLLFRGKTVKMWSGPAKCTPEPGSRVCTHKPWVEPGSSVCTYKPWVEPGSRVCTYKPWVEKDGGQWIPYQPATSPTPASPEYVSETSAESAAAARVLALFTGSDRFGYSMPVEKGSSRIEPGITPTQPLTLKWETFTEAADDAGLAGRYAGIHFAAADLAGRKLGRLAADRAFARAQLYFSGTLTPRAAEQHVTRCTH